MDSHVPTELLKCVIVGDGTVGKTCLLISYARDEFPNDYVPTVFDNYVVSVPAGVANIKLHLFDTAGNEGYEELRRLCYTNSDIYLLCYAIDNKTSYEHIKLQWYSEIRQRSPDATIILVATKSDLRKQKPYCVSTQAGEKLAKNLGLHFMECSAWTRENIREIFNLAITLELRKRKLVEGPDETGIVPFFKTCFMKCFAQLQCKR